MPGASFYQWEGDKIKEYNSYFDQMALLTQIGVIPPPGQEPQASARQIKEAKQEPPRASLMA